MILFTVLMMMLGIGLIRLGVSLAWGMTKILFGIIAFILSPFLLVVMVLGFISAYWLPVIVVVLFVSWLLKRA